MSSAPVSGFWGRAGRRGSIVVSALYFAAACGAGDGTPAATVRGGATGHGAGGVDGKSSQPTSPAGGDSSGTGGGVAGGAAGSGGAGGAAAEPVDAARMGDDVSVPASPVPAGAFSNPGAVKVPSFPDRKCPVGAGASTAAINAAIASCSMMGGGSVVLAPGNYTTGSIHMMSNVKLDLNGASIKGSGVDGAEPYTTPIACQDEGHRHWHNALIWGENIENFAIVGPGSIDGGGLDSNLQKQIAFKSSRVMLFDNFTQTQTGHFGYLLTDCHDITMTKLTMHPSRDGVDLMQCTNVNAHDLTITGGPDDAFALKNDCSIGKRLGTDNVTVANSTLSSGCTALQIGSETWGDFTNISWSNIKVTAGGKSGIGLQMNDGANLKNLSYDNITLTGTSFPIFINVTSLLRGPTKDPGHAENIRFSNITASNIVAGNNHTPQNTAIVISGEPGSPNLGIVFEHVKVTFPGGGAPVGDPPEGTELKASNAYNPRFITPMPAYGLFARHAKGIELHDVDLGFSAPDTRPAIIARDIDGLVVDRLKAQKTSGPSLQAEGVKNLTIKGSAPLPDGTMPSVDKSSL